MVGRDWHPDYNRPRVREKPNFFEMSREEIMNYPLPNIEDSIIYARPWGSPLESRASQGKIMTSEEAERIKQRAIKLKIPKPL